jgi:hypothetical protein
MPGQPPDSRAKTKNPKTGEFVEIGPVWKRAKDGFSGTIDRTKIPNSSQ